MIINHDFQKNTIHISMKASPETQINRLSYLLINNFEFKEPCYWVHKSGNLRVNQDAVENAPQESWDKLTASIEYFLNKHNF